MALATFRAIVLSHVRLRVSNHAPHSIGSSTSLSFIRSFAEGTYLDKNQVTERVLNVVKHFDKVDESKVTPQARFKEDLGLDSLDTVEVVMAFEEEFAIEIPDSEADQILSTQQAIDFIASHPQAK